MLGNWTKGLQMPKELITRNAPLYVTFWIGLPPFRSRNKAGTLDVRALASSIDATYQTIYVWFNKQMLPSRRMKTLIELEGSTLTMEKLMKFIS